MQAVLTQVLITPLRVTYVNLYFLKEKIMKLMFSNKPAFTEVDPYKLYYNVGGLMDIPTGKYVKGAKGENILNGGLGLLTAVIGKGNTFKSTISNFMMLSAVSKVASSGTLPYINTYDTEMNIQLDRLLEFAHRFDSLEGLDLFSMGAWSTTDKTIHLGNEWFKILKDFLIGEKVKNANKYRVDTPFVTKDGATVKTIFPSFGMVDSLSEFETEAISEIGNKNQLGDSGANTMFMRAGLDKTRLITELTSLCNSSSHYMVLTGHLGAEIPMSQGPYTNPTKKLQHMKPGEKIKGGAEKLYFLSNTMWETTSASALINQNTKGPEYPRTRTDIDEGSKDLNVVTIRTLRNKTGVSGVAIELVVSQSEGVLDTLSEFRFLKGNDDYGFEGNKVTYNLVIYPEVKLGRTTIRELIDTDPLLRRAIKITADLLQIKQIYHSLKYPVPDIKDLYTKLEAEYGWDKLLRTRDYWTFDNYKHEIPFLSTMDLIEMYHGVYKPYWWKDEKK